MAESKPTVKSKDMFLEYFMSYKAMSKDENEEEMLTQVSDPFQELKRLDNELEKCVEYMKEAKYDCSKILN